MRRAVLVAALAAAVVSGCGDDGDGGGSAEDALRETAASVGEIRSADMTLELLLSPRDGAGDGRLGFRLEGPVDLEAGDLPAARLQYTQIAGPQEGGATFISTGDEAFVEVEGTAYALSGEQTGAVRESAAGVTEGVELPVGRWFVDPELAEGDAVDGEPTDRIRADLDAVAALRDVFEAAAQAGAEVPDLSGAGAEELREAVKSSSAELVTGREDRLMRRLHVEVEFEVEPPAVLRGELGELAGGTFSFDLALEAVNEPVEVEAPADPQPAGALG